MKKKNTKNTTKPVHKIDSLRRFLLPCSCISPTTTSSTTTAGTPVTTKKRLSTSLRDDIPEHPTKRHTSNNNNQERLREEDEDEDQEEDQDSSTTTEESVNSYSSITPTPPKPTAMVPPRASKSMVIGTIFGHRRSRVRFCIQHDRFTSKPCLFLEFSISTHLLVKEMQSGFVRIALECTRPDLSSCPLHSVPVWGICINGRKVGFAKRKKTSEKDRMILKTMQSMTVGAGVIPMETASGGDEGELIYMRANYERVIAGYNSESFHLINPDGELGQEFSVFLLRSA